MTRLLNGQILFALGLAFLNTVYASQLLEMGRPFASGEPGPSFLPAILCGFVYIAIACILIGEIRRRPEDRDTATESDTVPMIGMVGPIIAIGLTCLFIVGFFYVGYLVSAGLYAFLITLYFNYEQNGTWTRSLLIALVTSVALTLFGWLFFVKLFDLYLPIWEL